MVEEMWPRYGSFPGFNPIVELSMTFHNLVSGANGQRQAMFLENVSGLANRILRNFALSEKDTAIAALQEKVDDDSVAALKRELGELEEQLAAAQAADRDAEARAGDAEAKVQEAEARAQKSAAALEDLESRLDEASRARQAQADNMAELEKQLQKQTRAAADAEEAAQRFRAELLEANAQASRVPDDVSSENDALQAEVIKLEGMVRERTEQLNKLRWQQDMIEKQGGSSEGSDSKMLVVLNQQLQSAREENQRLKDRVRDLESAPSPEPVPAPVAADEPDDLSSIKGIGPKLVKQLRKLGVTSFDQIATLSEADLDDEKHPLHGMKGRIIKDNWIEQAARLGGI